MKKYYRRIFFTNIPLKGKFKYKDVFQIFPCELEGTPKPKHFEHYPNIIEYWMVDEEVVEIENPLGDDFLDLPYLASQINKEQTILNLLSSFCNNLFFTYQDMSGSWGMPIYNDTIFAELEKVTSSWCYKNYSFPGLREQLQISNFSEPIYDDLIMIKHREYYLHLPCNDSDTMEMIYIPNSLEQILDEYFALDIDAKQAMDNAMYHLVSAMELRNKKKTLSLICAFTALETIIDYHYKDQLPDKCNECGQLKYSVSKKFIDFLLNFAGGAKGNKKQFNAYYKKRSELIHKGINLWTEKLFPNIPREKQDRDFIISTEVRQITKLAIANWLGTRNFKMGLDK
jgi:hypothetical protein